MNKASNVTVQAMNLEAGMEISYNGQSYLIEAVAMMGMEHVNIWTNNAAVTLTAPNDAWFVVLS